MYHFIAFLMSHLRAWPMLTH